MGYLVKKAIFDGFIFGYLGFALYMIIVSPGEEVVQAEFSKYVGYFFSFQGLGLLLTALLSFFKVDTLGEILFAPPNKKILRIDSVPAFKTFWGWETLSFLAITIYLGIQQTGFSIVELLDADAISHAMNMLAQILSPDWSVLPRAIIKVVETIFIAFMATVIAVPIAFVVSFFSAKNIMSGSGFAFAVYNILRTVFNISRSVEPILWAIIFSVWVGVGPYAGMLALMVHSVASLAKQYSEIVECVEEGPIEGIQATGASFIQTVWFAVVPQVVLPYISFTIYRWDINVRMATIIGFVGGGGIGELLLQFQGQARWPQVGCIIFVIAFIVWAMDMVSAYVREAIK